MTEPALAPSEVAEADAAARPSGLTSRFLGVVFSPTATFQQVVLAPRPFITLVLVSVISAGVSAGFFATEIGQQAWLETTIQQQERFGAVISDAQYQGMQRIAEFLPYIVLAQVLILGPLVTMFLAWLTKAGFAVFAGAEATFGQTLDVMALSGVVMILRALFTLPLNYVRESMTSTTNLAAFVPMLPADSFVVRFLGTIDVFVVWWVAVLAIGLAVLFKRRTGPIATTLFGVYALIALGIATVLSLLA